MLMFATHPYDLLVKRCRLRRVRVYYVKGRITNAQLVAYITCFLGAKCNKIMSFSLIILFYFVLLHS